MKTPQSISKENKQEKKYWLYRKDKRKWIFLCMNKKLDVVKKSLKEYSCKKGDLIITLRTVKILEKVVCHN